MPFERKVKLDKAMSIKDFDRHTSHDILYKNTLHKVIQVSEFE